MARLKGQGSTERVNRFPERIWLKDSTSVMSPSPVAKLRWVGRGTRSPSALSRDIQVGSTRLGVLLSDRWGSDLELHDPGIEFEPIGLAYLSKEHIDWVVRGET